MVHKSEMNDSRTVEKLNTVYVMCFNNLPYLHFFSSSHYNIRALHI